MAFFVKAFSRKPEVRINLTVMAKEVIRRETGPRQIDITQGRELLRHARTYLAEQCLDNPKGFAAWLMDEVRAVKKARKLLKRLRPD